MTLRRVWCEKHKKFYFEEDTRSSAERLEDRSVTELLTGTYSHKAITRERKNNDTLGLAGTGNEERKVMRKLRNGRSLTSLLGGPL